MHGQLPTVLVSSTFYDLKEVRQTLANFIETLGYRPLISESSAFPVDPTSGTIENCRRQVEENADILVLVIGRRYGSIEKSSGKSVTNLEYLGAKAKGIPIYAFIEKSTMTLYQEWRAAEETTRKALSNIVENGQLFRFVEQIRSDDSVWTFGFEAAAEINETLRAQFAYQMRAGLDTERGLRSSPEQDFLRTLRGKTLRIALEKPAAWEYRLFANALSDEVISLEGLRKEYALELSFGKGESVPSADFSEWTQVRLDELSHLSNAATKLVNEVLKTAVGPPGTPGSAPEIVFAAHRLGRIYREALEWAINVRRAVPSKKELKQFITPLALCSESLITAVEDWAYTLSTKLDQALIDAASGAPQELQFTFTLDPTRLNQLMEALDRFKY
jgi:hypothetical protein